MGVRLQPPLSLLGGGRHHAHHHIPPPLRGGSPVEPAAEAVDYFQNGSPLEIIFSFVPLVATVVLPALCVLMQVVVPMLSPAVITPADTKQWGAPAKKGFGNAAFRRAAVMAAGRVALDRPEPKLEECVIIVAGRAGVV